jgi:hypothetical protein
MTGASKPSLDVRTPIPLRTPAGGADLRDDRAKFGMTGRFSHGKAVATDSPD